MNMEIAIRLCEDWLKAWSGNKPETLLAFYSEDAYYQDPAKPQGLKGVNQIIIYFKKLLAANPNWKWKREELYPTEKGFVLKWNARIPVGSEIVEEKGMDIVEVRNNLICRNEVYFDRTKLQSKLKKIA